MGTPVAGAVPSAALYRYRDAQGVEHLAQSLSEIPAAVRQRAVAVAGGVPVDKRTLADTASDNIATNGLALENSANQGIRGAKGAVR